MDPDLQSIQEARSLLEGAHAAWKQFEDYSEDQVDRIVKAISEAAIAAAERLARLAVEETGFGNVADKTTKNLFSADHLYRAIQPLKTVGIVREDKDKQILEVASSVGVIAGIIPSTNPTSTTIYKALISLKGRNAIVFSPHPSAAGCIGATAAVVSRAAVEAGAPEGVIGCMRLPTTEGTRELMQNPKTALILATGGPGLVRAAYSSGKPAFGVGPGNVPAYVERSADPAKAVERILTGKTFDNGTLCSSEQSIICDEAIRGRVLEELRRRGAHVCDEAEKARLERVIQTPRGTLNTAIVGKSAPHIASLAGVDVPDGTRALVAFVEGVGPDHPFSMEKLSPLLGFYTVADWKAGCERCIDILSYGGLGHTLGLHCDDEEVIRQFALHKPAFRICVNTPAALGAVGYTTNLFPSMTLGCGAAGGNITSDNISPLHLINLKRVAFGVRDVKPAVSVGMTPDLSGRSQGTERDRIEGIVDRWLARKGASPPLVSPPSSTPAAATPLVEPSSSAPPLETYGQLEAQVVSEPPAPAVVAAFVCEDDVRAAAGSNSRIVVDEKTIITPSARELGGELDVFVRSD